MDEVRKRLESIVGPAQLLVDGGTTDFTVDERRPETVVFPGTAEEVSAVLAVCHETRTAVLPWGGGVHMGLGGVPRRLDVILGLGRLDQVIDHEPGDMTSTVQAGMPLAKYQAHLNRNGQFLALDPPGGGRATVGGILAANVSGPRRLRYGTARDLLIGLRVVDGVGTLTKGGAKVVKNVTGYDMNKLYVGSLGTLGVIVDATFRLHPLPAMERTWVAAFPAAAKAGEAVSRILGSPIVPSALELLSEGATAEVSRRSGVLPGMSGVLLAVAVASVPEAVTAQLHAARELTGAAGEGLLLDGQAHEAFWGAIRDLAAEEKTGMLLKAGVLLVSVAEALERGECLAAQHGLGVAIVAEAGTGVLRYYFRAAEGADRAQRLARVVGPLRDFAVQARGSLVVLQAPPEVKEAVDVWGAVGKSFALMQGLKAQFDPRGILNPGRFVGGL
jgi:glycolate oxidase FAD binding subunit